MYLEGNQRTQRGTTFTTGPGTYKIPSVSDVPVVFNVSLLDRAPNPKAIFSSKVRKALVIVLWLYSECTSSVIQVLASVRFVHARVIRCTREC